MAAFPLHLIPLLPLLGAAFALLLGKRAGKDLTSLVTCGAVLIAGLVSVKAVWTLHAAFPHGGALADTFYDAPWIQAGDLKVTSGLLLDNLSSVMILIVTGIGFLIHVYSTAYMEHDEGFTRFFGYLNLFTGAMLILVLGDSMLVTFVGWEGVGLCSYLLIGFWFDKEANASAGRKAFVVNRVGDFAFLLAMFLLLYVAGTLRYGAFDGAGMRQVLAQPLWFGLPAGYYVSVLVLIGATGKSAQIPLYIWLPDAMAGPTPVSALIHAATMVTAGVYVIVRMHPVFEVFPAVLAVVAVIGAATALLAATIAVAQRDLKKVLAYSTISQLGFMFAAVGSHLFSASLGQATSNYQGGIFHLMTHAFFKAGLFLGAGSVMHALSGEGDITRMGGLAKKLKHTHATFLVYCLAIAGIFPLSGFWSKDAVLGGALAARWTAMSAAPQSFGERLDFFFAHHLGHLLYAMLLVTAGLTAFYMFRLYFLVFRGEFRGTDEQKHHLHESPPAMTLVLWVLAIGSIVVGWIGIPDAVWAGADRFGEWLSPVVLPQARPESAGEFWYLAAIALAVSGAGIAVAYALYGHGFAPAVRSFVARVPRTYKLVLHKYYIDEIYDALVVRPLRWLAILLDAFDRFFIDMVLVNGTGMLIGGIGKLVKYVQNGDVQRYVIGILAGSAALVLVATNYSVWNARKFSVRIDGRDVQVDATRGPTDKRLRFRIKWDGDKDFGSAQSDNVFNHHFDTPGRKQITIEAIDPRWGTSWSEARKVEVR